MGTVVCCGYTCKDCGKPFTLEEGEIKWYEAKDWPLPKRCKECRKKRREGKKIERSE
jgi:hypothetical protein